MNVPALKSYIIARACETSTWRGVIFVTTGFGAAISPDLGQIGRAHV